MKALRTILIGGAVVAGAFALTACGESVTPAAAPAPVTVSVTKTPAPVTVSVTKTAAPVTETETETETITETSVETVTDTEGTVTVECADLYAKTDKAFALFNVAFVMVFNGFNNTDAGVVKAGVDAMDTSTDALKATKDSIEPCGSDMDSEYRKATMSVNDSLGAATTAISAYAKSPGSSALTKVSDAVDAFQDDYGVYLGVRDRMGA
jgi:hypothetical protein